jgi:hypothetical protein
MESSYYYFSVLIYHLNFFFFFFINKQNQRHVPAQKNGTRDFKVHSSFYSNRKNPFKSLPTIFFSTENSDNQIYLCTLEFIQKKYIYSIFFWSSIAWIYYYRLSLLYWALLARAKFRKVLLLNFSTQNRYAMFFIVAIWAWYESSVFIAIRILFQSMKKFQIELKRWDWCGLRRYRRSKTYNASGWTWKNLCRISKYWKK